MDIVEATRLYENWAFSRITLVPADLARKHAKMAGSPFAFLRATFYRWAQLWPERCPELTEAPRVLALGDLHVENFGTWRDLEGRLVWGINDFDEVYPAPYPVDLVRLAASALLAADEGNVEIERSRIAEVLLDGYQKHLAAETPLPFVLEEPFRWLRKLALGELRDPAVFWAKFDKLPPAEKVPGKLRRATEKRFPEPDLTLRWVQRTAGMGSLGRQRFVALARWHGSTVAREGKALLPSAWAWALGKGSDKLRYNDALDRMIRCPDPFSREVDGWIIRRLAPDCIDIDLGDLPEKRLEEKLLRAMGAETANLHLGTPDRRDDIRRDLAARPAGWLQKAAETMAEATRDDWSGWQKAQAPKAVPA